MRVVVAPDSFKESLTSPDAAALIAEGIHVIHPEAEVVARPLADGGEGFTQTVASAWESSGARVEWRGVSVTGPMTSLPPVARVRTRYVTASSPTGTVAALESAAAVGIDLVPPEFRDPLHATTRGVGELVRAALDDGVDEIVLGIGGTLTVDGGAGLLVALGGRLVDADGCDVEPEPALLTTVASVDLSGLDPRLATTRLRVACDVDNPLLGPRGAATVFGPQKGASPTDVETLEVALAHLAGLVDSDETFRDRPGAGAAGGLGMMLMLLGAVPEAGALLVADLIGLEEAIASADVVITGEGSLDGQTLDGKGPGLVARLAAQHGVPCWGFAGRLGDGHERLRDHGFSRLIAITVPGTPRDEALRQGGANLRRAVVEALRG